MTNSSLLHGTAMPKGRGMLALDFDQDGAELGQGGTMLIKIGTRMVAEGRIGWMILSPADLGVTFDTGRDTGVHVTTYPRQSALDA